MTFPLTKSAFKKHLESMRPRQIAGFGCDDLDCPLARVAHRITPAHGDPDWAWRFAQAVDDEVQSRMAQTYRITAGKCLQIGREIGIWE